MLDIYLTERAEIVRYFNKHFRFVFTPKVNPSEDLICWVADYTDCPINRKNYRHLVGAGSIHKYIGRENANKVILAAQNSKTDKTTLKFRKWGKIEIYAK